MPGSVKILALVLVVAMLCVSLVSCGLKLSGDYRTDGGDSAIADAETTYSFRGNKYTKTVKTTLLGNVSTTEETGTYEITETDGGLEITFSTKAEDGQVTTVTATLEKGEDHIKIGPIPYSKVN